MKTKTILVAAFAALVCAGTAVARPGPRGFHGHRGGFHRGWGGHHHHHRHHCWNRGWGWGLGGFAAGYATAALFNRAYSAPYRYGTYYTAPVTYTAPVVTAPVTYTAPVVQTTVAAPAVYTPPVVYRTW